MALTKSTYLTIIYIVLTNTTPTEKLRVVLVLEDPKTPFTLDLDSKVDFDAGASASVDASASANANANAAAAIFLKFLEKGEGRRLRSSMEVHLLRYVPYSH
jgi:hypothetical protein